MRELRDIYFVYMVVMWGVSLSRSGENTRMGYFEVYMPSSHLPRMVSDKFVYDFLCDFVWHRRWLRATEYVFTTSHCLLASCDFFYGASGVTQG